MGRPSFLPLPLETLVNQGFAGPFFQKFSEYSEKVIFEGCFLDVHNLFIFDSPIPSFSIPLFSGFEKYF